MTAKEYLNRVRVLNAYIDCKYEEIRQCRELAAKCSPSSMFDRNGNVSDKVGRTAARIADLEAEIRAEADKLISARREIVNVISRVEDASIRALLEMRYLSGYSWRKIALTMHYSEKHITGYLHRKALRDIEKLIPHDTFSVL